MNPLRTLPPETAPQRAIWCSWPGNPDTWPLNRKEALAQYADLIATLSRLQPVELICPDVWKAEALLRLQAADTALESVHWHAWPLNDAWCRDHGPLFVRNASGELELIDLPYNAWGGKVSPWDADDRITQRVSELRNLACRRLPIIGEGGALEISATGVLLTTESVWLNPNRNPGLSKSEVEQIFATYFGVSETIWLPDGFPGDDTDGHIDTLARFIDPTCVAVPLAPEGHPDAALLTRNRDQLAQWFQVAELPHPAPRASLLTPTRRLPQSYANYLVVNQAVLVPTYAQPDTDTRAQSVLQELFPNREILPIPCEALIEEGGAVHCLTMQEPL